jgi:hypothetical protein
MSTRQAVVGLCAALEVPVSDLDDDSIDVIAIRIIAELGDRPTAVGVGKIVDQVRFAERPGGGSEPSSVEPDPSPAPVDIPLGQRAMDAAVAGIDEVAQRRGVKRGAIHPACWSSWSDNGTACSDCTWHLCTDESCTHDVCGWERYFG